MPDSRETSRADSTSSVGAVGMESHSPESSNLPDFIRDWTILETLSSPESTLNSAHESLNENSGINEEELETVRKLAQSIQAGLDLDGSEAASIWKFKEEESQQKGWPEFYDSLSCNTASSEENQTENPLDRNRCSEEEMNLFKYQRNGISQECLGEVLKYFKPIVSDNPSGYDAVDEVYEEQYSLQTFITIASVLNFVLDDLEGLSDKPVDYVQVQNLKFSCSERDQAVSAYPVLESSQSLSDPTNPDGSLPSNFFPSDSEMKAQREFRNFIDGLTNTLAKIDDLLKVMDSRSHWKRVLRKGRFPVKDVDRLRDSFSDFPFPTRIDTDSRILKLWTETRPALSKLAVFLRKTMGSCRNPMTFSQMRTILISIRKSIGEILEYGDLCEKLPVDFNASSDARYVFGVEHRVFDILVNLMNVTYEIDRINGWF